LREVCFAATGIDTSGEQLEATALDDTDDLETTDAGDALGIFTARSAHSFAEMVTS
jgi:hypothetical protein